MKTMRSALQLKCFILLTTMTLFLGGCKGLNSSKYTDAKLEKAAEIQTLNEKRTELTCLAPWGQTLQEGESITAFKLQTTCEKSCASSSQVRVCKGGSLSGDVEYVYNSCTPDICHSCKLPWGGLLEHGGETPSFKTDEIQCGGNCSTAENRVVRKCEDGTLTGPVDFNLGACKVNRCPCAFPWSPNEKMPDGANVRAFDMAQVACGQNCETRGVNLTCSDGSLTGPNKTVNYSPFNKAACAVTACLPCNWRTQTITSGGAVSGFSKALVEPGDSCQAKAGTCFNGNIQGGVFPECKKKCGFTWLDINNVSHSEVLDPGASRDFYTKTRLTCTESSTPYLKRATCDATGTGALKDNTGATITVSLYGEARNVCQNCTLGATTILDGQSTLKVYSRSSGSCTTKCLDASTQFICRSGTLVNSDGTPADLATYRHNSCADTCVNCTLAFTDSASQILQNDGTTVRAYKQASVACGTDCQSQSALLHCNDAAQIVGPTAGDFSLYNKKSCAVASCASCTWGSSSVPSGGTLSGFVKALVEPNETCQAVTGTCFNGTIQGTLVPECKKKCGFTWLDADSVSHTVTMIPGEGRDFYTKTRLTCTESSATYLKHATCDLAGTGALKDNAGATITASLYGEARPICVNCPFPSASPVADGTSTGTLYSRNPGTCANKCENSNTQFVCRAGILFKPNNVAATPAELALYSKRTCTEGCVECRHTLQNGEVVVIPVGATTSLSALDKVEGCDGNCSEQQATIRCTTAGNLVIESAINLSLRVQDLKYRSCEKSEGTRCASGGNPPVACSLPGEYWKFDGRRGYQPRMDRNILYVNAHPRQPSGINPPYLSYLQKFQLGDSATWSDDSPKVTDYGRHPLYMDEQSWLYQVSPDSRITFYDTPEVDQSLAPGDNCDKHMALKTCDPDGYWLLSDETVGFRGGRGPLLESARSSKYKYASCTTLAPSRSWTALKSRRADCLANLNSGTPGACLFPKNPFYANGGNPTSSLVSKDSLQSLWINWKDDSISSGTLTDDSFRIIETNVFRSAVCRQWEIPFTDAEWDDFINKRKSCVQIITSSSTRPKIKSNLLTLDLHLDDKTALDLQFTGSSFAKSELNGAGRAYDTRDEAKSPSRLGKWRDPVTNIIYDTTSVIGLVNEDRPGVSLATYYQLQDFSHTLSGRLGPIYPYFRHKQLDIHVGLSTLVNNAGFVPAAQWWPGEAGNDYIAFGPQLALISDSTQPLGFYMKLGAPLSFDGSITAHELGHANLYYTNRIAGISSRCQNSSGCFGAIHEGQADFMAAILYPDSPAVGDGLTENAAGIRSCGIPRNPALNGTLSANTAFQACGGEVHAMGTVYAAVWWKMWNLSSADTEHRRIERLFMEHLKYLDGDTNFVSAFDAIRVAEMRLFPGVRTYSDAYSAEMSARLSAPALNTRTIASTTVSISTLDNITLAQNSPGTATVFQVSVGASNTTTPLLAQVTATSSNPTLIPAAGLRLVPSSQGPRTQTLSIVPAQNQNGTATVTVSASVPGGAATGTFTVTVLPSTRPAGVGGTQTVSVSLNYVLVNGLPFGSFFPAGSTIQIVGFSGQGLIKGTPPKFFPEFGDLGTVTIWVRVDGVLQEIIVDLSHPTVIHDVAEFDLMNKNPWGFFTIEEDIIVESGQQIPLIGTNTKPFLGVFDAQTFAINGLRISAQSQGTVAWIAALRGSVTNLRFGDANVKGNASAVGGVVGVLLPTGLLQSINYVGTVAGGYTQGGLVAVSSGRVKKSSFKGRLVPLLVRKPDGSATLSVTDIRNLNAAGIAGRTATSVVYKVPQPTPDPETTVVPNPSISPAITDIKNRIQFSGAYLSGKASAQIIAVPAGLAAYLETQVATPKWYGNPTYPNRPDTATLAATHLFCGNMPCKEVDILTTGDGACGVFYQYSALKPTNQAQTVEGYEVLDLLSTSTILAINPKPLDLIVGATAGRVDIAATPPPTDPVPIYSGATGIFLFRDLQVDADTLLAAPVSNCAGAPVSKTVVVAIPPRVTAGPATLTCTLQFTSAAITQVNGCGTPPSYVPATNCTTPPVLYGYNSGEVLTAPLTLPAIPEIDVATRPVSATFNGTGSVVIKGGTSRLDHESYTDLILAKAVVGSTTTYFNLVLGTGLPGAPAKISNLPTGLSATINCTSP